MHRNGFLSEDTDELLDEVTALVDKMDSYLPSHPPVHEIDHTAGQTNRVAAEGQLRLDDCASTSYYNNRVDVSTIPCYVCGDRTSGTHYGVLTCEGCKGFFRRFRARAISQAPICNKDNACPITKDTRNRCQACRYRKCLKVGMHKDNVKFGRKSKQDLAELRRQAAHCTKALNSDYQFAGSDHRIAAHQPHESSLSSQLSLERMVRNSSHSHRSAVTSFSDPSLDGFNQERNWTGCEFYKDNSHNGRMEKHKIVSVKTEQCDGIDYWPQMNGHKSVIVESHQQFNHHVAPITSVHFSYPPPCTTSVTSSYSPFATSPFSLNFGYSDSANEQIPPRDLNMFQKSHSVHMAMIGMEKQNKLVQRSEFPAASSNLMEECVDSGSVFSRSFQC